MGDFCFCDVAVSRHEAGVWQGWEAVRDRLIDRSTGC
jgi:hypothetical protein